MTEKECLEMIEDNDLYNFLIVDPASRTTEAATSAEGEASLDGIECSFRHISILNAIYESLAFRERLTANRSVGLMIESILNEGNREDLLPSLDYHFSRTAEIEKLVKYKEELG
ncbi:hypothetical protein HK101_007285 [Irineochytrium annulatum]|nr:hypothetical protein HK101_007285 [Irineochytrium annulatum]